MRKTNLETATIPQLEKYIKNLKEELEESRARLKAKRAEHKTGFEKKQVNVKILLDSIDFLNRMGGKKEQSKYFVEQILSLAYLNVQPTRAEVLEKNKLLREKGHTKKLTLNTDEFETLSQFTQQFFHAKKANEFFNVSIDMLIQIKKQEVEERETMQNQISFTEETT